MKFKCFTLIFIQCNLRDSFISDENFPSFFIHYTSRVNDNVDLKWGTNHVLVDVNFKWQLKMLIGILNIVMNHGSFLFLSDCV